METNRLLNAEAFWLKVTRWFTLAGAVSLIVMTLIVVADVSRRYLFNRPIDGATESLQLILPYFIFFGMAYTLATGGHVRVTLILERASPRFRLWADILAGIVGLFLIGIVAIWGFEQFRVSFLANELMPSSVTLPWWVGKFALPAGYAVFWIQFLLTLLVNLGRAAHKIPMPGQQGEKLLQTG